MVSYDQIFENNRRWAEAKRRQDPDYFPKLAREQRPEYLYIGCSDSRVPSNEIMGVEPGSVFVHRNIGNVVANTDLNVAAVIDFAVVHLKVKHIIVCGHYNCGGVKAAMQARDLGILNPWLRNIRDVYRLHRDELAAIQEEERRYERLIELSVVEQCINVIKTAAVQHSYLTHGYPLVHGWVFDIRTGLIKDLRINFEETLKAIQEIYNLTSAPWSGSWA
ncbi:MAG: carbonic anhydrase [Bryobacteraceae bacterium]|jgi:carbonic anhydrase